MQPHVPGDSPVPSDALDFLSPAFSAEQALLSSPSRIHLPCPEVQPCDNLDHYSSVVRGLTRRRPGTGPPLAKTEDKEKTLPQPVRDRQPQSKSVITVMESEFT